MAYSTDISQNMAYRSAECTYDIYVPFKTVSQFTATTRASSEIDRDSLSTNARITEQAIVSVSLASALEFSTASSVSESQQRDSSPEVTLTSSGSCRLDELHEGITTLMLRNVPNMYTRNMMLSELTARGLINDVNFLYMPIDLRYQCNPGYCFVNLTTHEGVLRFYQSFAGSRMRQVQSDKVTEVGVGRVQGLQANIEAYRNNAVMQLPEQYRPVMMRNGEYVPFPAPTRARAVRHEKKGVSSRQVAGKVYHTRLVPQLLGNDVMRSI